jgi:DNA phosphorothioation-dependent restriction protein DptG
MAYKEKLFSLFDELNESDQKKAYEFIKFLAHQHCENIEDEEVIELFGKNYFIVPD